MSTDAPPRLSIGIIGAGKAGAVLGAALRRAGHHVNAVSAVSDISRLRAEALLPGVPIVPVTEVGADADLVLIAVPDDVLPELVRGLVASGAIHAGQFVVHPSGRYGLEVLAPAYEVGALPLALHPVMTFTGTSIDLDRLADAPFGVTAPEQIRPVAEALVVEMGGEPIWVPEEARSLYHAALALGANYLNTLVNASVSLLEEAGMESPQRLIAPLLSASLDNALRQGDAALTGPIARGDAQTVAAHVRAISEVDPLAAATYQAMGRLATDRALSSSLITMEQAGALLEVLAESGRGLSS